MVVGSEPGGQQADIVDAFAGAQVGLLLYDVPAVIAPQRGAQTQPPGDM